MVLNKTSNNCLACIGRNFHYVRMILNYMVLMAQLVMSINYFHKYIC